MSRDQANLRIDMWADSDWRELSEPAQRLYMLLLSNATLTYAGVADWRPNRLVALSASSTIEGIRHAASELQRKRFVCVDERTEEVLIRSFVKHDGLMARPNLVAAMSKAYGNIHSKRIREIFAFEIQKLRKRDTENKMKWENAATVLNEPARELEGDLGDDLAIEVTNDLGNDPNVDLAVIDEPHLGNDLPLTTATATATTTSPNGECREVDELSQWKPTAKHYEYGKEINVFVNAEAEKFKKHAAENDRDLKNINLAFTNWLKRLAPKNHPSTLTQAELDDRRRNPWRYS